MKEKKAVDPFCASFFFILEFDFYPSMITFSNENEENEMEKEKESDTRSRERVRERGERGRESKRMRETRKNKSEIWD